MPEDPEHDSQLDDLQPPSIIAEFWEFILDNKKFFLIPILLVLLVIGILVVLGSTSAAPFIYTLW